MGSKSDAQAVKRRIEGWRAAERRERAHRREQGPLDPEAALAAAIELGQLLPSAEQDAVRTREIEHTRRAWAKLRAYFACPPSDHGR